MEFAVDAGASGAGEREKVQLFAAVFSYKEKTRRFYTWQCFPTSIFNRPKMTASSTKKLSFAICEFLEEAIHNNSVSEDNKESLQGYPQANYLWLN